MPEVVIYTLSTCPWCQKAKQFFINNNIPFESVDQDLLSDAEQQEILITMDQYSSEKSFPFAIINGTAVIGYNPERYTELLGL